MIRWIRKRAWAITSTIGMWLCIFEPIEDKYDRECHKMEVRLAIASGIFYVVVAACIWVWVAMK
jgi:hypothetical protein